MQEGPICDICHISPLRPHGFEQSSGFDRTEGDGKTTAWTNMTETLMWMIYLFNPIFSGVLIFVYVTP